MIRILLVIFAYFLVGAFWAGAARVHGELIWIEIIQGERKEEWPAQRWHYMVIYPLRWFFLWPLGHLLASRRINEERRRK